MRQFDVNLRTMDHNGLVRFFSYRSDAALEQAAVEAIVGLGRPNVLQRQIGRENLAAIWEVQARRARKPATPRKVWVVEAEHQTQDPRIVIVCATEEFARKEAARLTNIMLKDDGNFAANVTADNFEIGVERLQGIYGAATCYVEVTAKDVKED